MSIWTHVAAVIRFDSNSMRMPEFKPDLNCGVPCGSEGGLTTTLWTNPNTSSRAAYVANIFGDLRNYDDVDQIIEYLNRITNGKMVRSGIATIQVEGRLPVVLHFHDEKWLTLPNV